MANQPGDLITNEGQGHESKKSLRKGQRLLEFLTLKMDFKTENYDDSLHTDTIV
jgi:hypothetical protein